MDFWSTWCVPCIAALPNLRQLVANLPAERFVLPAISVDGQIKTVTEFMQREAVPWYSWRVGLSSQLSGSSMFAASPPI